MTYHSRNRDGVTKTVNNRFLVEESESHVVILLFLGFFLLFLFLLFLGSRGSTSSSRCSTSSSRSSSGSRANVGDQVLDVARLQCLTEQTRPVGLNLNTSSLEYGCQLLGSDSHIVISEDESGVDTGELRVRHSVDLWGCASFLKDLARKREQGKSLVEVNQAIIAFRVRHSVDLWG